MAPNPNEMKKKSDGDCSFWPVEYNLNEDIYIKIGYSKNAKIKFTVNFSICYDPEMEKRNSTFTLGQMMEMARKGNPKPSDLLPPIEKLTSANKKELEKRLKKDQKFKIKDLMNPTDDEFEEMNLYLTSGKEKSLKPLIKLTIHSILTDFQENFPDEFEKLWPGMTRHLKSLRVYNPNRWIIEWPFEIDFENGKLYKKYSKRNNENEDRDLISDLVVVTAEYQDIAENDEVYFRFLIKNGTRTQRHILMPASKISDKEFLDNVRKQIIVISGEEKNFTKFLTLFAMQNRDKERIDRYYFSSRTGWITRDEKRYFMLGNRVYDIDFDTLTDPVPIDGMSGYEDYFSGIGDSGDYDGWFKEWIPALKAADSAGTQIFIENLNLWFTVYALSASFLLEFFPGIENTLIVNSGTTSRGKSTIAKIAASLFGNPKRFITLGSGTANGIWDAWLKWDFLPSVMDEFTNTDPEIKENIPYWFASGKEKNRLNKEAKARKVREFRKNGYISLENDFVNRVMRTGIDARIIPIYDGLNLPPAGSDDVNTSRASIIDNLARIKSHEYYGFYKYEFLKTISETGSDKIIEMYNNISKEYSQTSDTLAARLGSNFSLFHVSGFLIEKTNIRLNIRDKINDDEINALVKKRCQEILDGTVRQIGSHDWQVVLEAVLARADNSETRARWVTDEELQIQYDPEINPIRYPDRIEGWFTNDGQLEFADISVDVVQSVCAMIAGKPSLKNVLKEWADKRILVKGPGENQFAVQQRHVQRQAGESVRTYIYRINLNEAKKMVDYDLTVRRRELLNNNQFKLEDFDHKERGRC